MKKTFFNPLANVDVAEFTPAIHKASTAKSNTSTSAVSNMEVGVCPTCKKPMITASTDKDTVYYCEEHRIALPMLNREG